VDVTVVGSTDATTVELPATGAPSPRVRSTMRQTLRDATLGEYEILEELGRGGMATVFLAHDIALDRKVAIKVMAPHLLEGEGMAERFKLEARTAAQLSHPHIIPIYAVRETESTLFFVMKFVEGKTLDEIIKRTGPMPIPMIKDILAKVGASLGYAHRRNVIHRDVKPGNIMIDEEGTPIMTDFGIAKVTERKGLTVTGTTIGTPAYMSPEQCEAKPVTGASDQYSLGVVAWEMLTGKTPFAGDSAVTTMYKHVHEPLPVLADFRPDAPAEVVETVTRMLAKKPTERWPSLEAAVKKLDVAGTVSTLDPIRDQLLELAKQPEGRELIARLSTPRSPMPSVLSTPVPARPSKAEVTPQRRRARARAAAAVVVLLVGSALAVVRPWDRGAEATSPAAEGTESSPAEPTGGGTPVDAASGADAGATVGTTPQPPVDPPPSTTTTTAPAGGTSAPPPITAPTGTTTRPAPTVASVTIVGASGGLEPGDQVTLSARALAEGGAAVAGGAPTWSSSAPEVATVSGNGVFTARAPGSVTISAVIAGVTGRTTIEIGTAAVQSIAVEPPQVSLTRGETASLTAQPRARSGPVAATVSWSSSEPDVATVSASGEVVAVGSGTATITARAGDASEIVRVTVTVDVGTAIAELVTAFARALESGDINAVARAYPGMTPQQRRDFSGAIASMEAATLSVGGVEASGDEATAMVTGQYVFNNDGRRQTSPVSFRASFQRSGGVWRMVQMQ
jgi:serine/threonine-protein kinase